MATPPYSSVPLRISLVIISTLLLLATSVDVSAQQSPAISVRDVVIVEDIVDTGLTLTYLQEILGARSPRNLRTVCLLSKPARRKVDVRVDYIGFTIEDEFVVGYGLDFGERYRNLAYIGVLEQTTSDA